MKRLVTGAFVEAEVAAGRRQIDARPSENIVTPDAWTRARELGAVFENVGAPATRPSAEGSAKRERDASGVLVVRGNSVKLGTFTGAGPDKKIGLLDLVTAEHGSPMAAGIMSFARADAFPWRLDYDEIDYVLEGVLHVRIDGRTMEGRAGDVMYIPKGSSIVFDTPSRVKVFYVTHPADWTQARPQK